MLGRARPFYPRFRRRLRISRADVKLGVFAFFSLLVAGMAWQWAPTGPLSVWLEHHALTALFVIGVASFLLKRQLNRVSQPVHHALANAFPGPPRRMLMPSVVDGDTIDDLAIGVRYRLANIDAPETGDGATCATERAVGFRASMYAKACIASAKRVEIRRTWRWDQYGRRVAFVLIDGSDLGEELIKEGFAHRWRGRRERWCGGRRPLSKLARARRECFACEICSD